MARYKVQGKGSLTAFVVEADTFHTTDGTVVFTRGPDAEHQHPAVAAVPIDQLLTIQLMADDEPA